ncbi:hypothetical protein A9Q84_16360 [Halobacteriovorax marinus]|uniref:CENP-V/GFA domain-containing protein n=1 Tax=Halobacteriovorax marinus TaxID=97084 RepID=A0A1Y5F4A3_9BACT|nr:hypothetical protein A9Q84_16360 [Halobacteriovorax marinus]
MLKGSCLCGKIAFEAEDIPNMVFNCHCSRCRKAHGSAFATQVFAQKESLKFIKGRELLKEFTKDQGIRTFCSECGSRLMNYGVEGTDYLSVAISAIDEPSNIAPVADCFVTDKFGWSCLDEGIKHFDALPEF